MSADQKNLTSVTRPPEAQVLGTVSVTEAGLLHDSGTPNEKPGDSERVAAIQERLGESALKDETGGHRYALVTERDDADQETAKGYVSLDSSDLGTRVQSRHYADRGLKEPQQALAERNRIEFPKPEINPANSDKKPIWDMFGAVSDISQRRASDPNNPGYQSHIDGDIMNTTMDFANRAADSGRQSARALVASLGAGAMHNPNNSFVAVREVDKARILSPEDMGNLHDVADTVARIRQSGMPADEQVHAISLLVNTRIDSLPPEKASLGYALSAFGAGATMEQRQISDVFADRLSPILS